MLNNSLDNVGMRVSLIDGTKYAHKIEVFSPLTSLHLHQPCIIVLDTIEYESHSLTFLALSKNAGNGSNPPAEYFSFKSRSCLVFADSIFEFRSLEIQFGLGYENFLIRITR